MERRRGMENIFRWFQTSFARLTFKTSHEKNFFPFSRDISRRCDAEFKWLIDDQPETKTWAMEKAFRTFLSARTKRSLSWIIVVVVDWVFFSAALSITSLMIVVSQQS